MTRKFLLGILLLAPLGFYPLLHSEPADDIPKPPSQQDPLTPEQRLAVACLAILPGQSFPGAIPWEPMRNLAERETPSLDHLPEQDLVALLKRSLAEKDPVAFLERTLALTPNQRLAVSCFAILPAQSFPSTIPWEPMRNLGQQKMLAVAEKSLFAFLKHALAQKDPGAFLERTLAEKDPVAFLECALARAEKDVHNYRCIFNKQERVNGKMRQKESIRIHFRKEPFSVHMEWLKGQDKAFRSLYVKGENDDLITVRPSSLIGFTLLKKVDATDVKATSRFGIDRFGMHFGARDTLEHMQAAQKERMLHVRYAGKQRVEELGGRWCYTFVRSPYDSPEGLPGENLNELTTYIDAATMLQTGSILKDTKGNLIATYFFRDIVVNPTFAEKQFDKDSL